MTLRHLRLNKMTNLILFQWSRTVSLNDFNDQMSYLNHNYRVLPLKNLLIDINESKPIPQNAVAVTFDDGYRSNYLLAFPVLIKYRIPATVFTIVKYIDAGTVGGYPALKWSDLKAMVSSGLVDVESHTYDLHHELPSGREGKMEPAVLARIVNHNVIETSKQQDLRIEADLLKSRQIIAEKVGARSDILCWPFGIYDNHDVSLANKAGFVYMIGKLGYCYPDNRTDDVGRVVVPGGMNLHGFINLTDPRNLTYPQAMGMELLRIRYHLSNVLKVLKLF
jgi:biofilm PGA synthesis lipoprotein PgaB